MSDIESTILEMITKLGGIEKFQSNPFAFVGEVFKHPELLGKIDELSKTPEMQKQIAESMNNPMFQQIIGNNPLLSGMMDRYKNRDTEADYIDSDSDENSDDDELSSDGYDISIPGWKAIDFLNPVSNQPFFIPEEPEKRIHFSDILAELPDECREPVEIIAEKRLQMHFSPAQMDRLESLAEKYDLTPLDLMATQGGFIGEVCYCATEAMPDDDLCDLAKFALSSLHRRSGYPVASYLAQVLLYLDSFDEIEKQDWENFVWSLSGNPHPGRDGNFILSWDDACLICEIASENLKDDPELFLAVCLGLLNWNVLSIDSVANPLSQAVHGYERMNDIRSLLMEALGGRKIYAMSLPGMRRPLVEDAISCVLSGDMLDALLERAQNWDETCVTPASILVDKLDLLWSKADFFKREAFLNHAIEMGDETLARAALRVGVAWQPEKYRVVALNSPYAGIRSWAEKGF